LLLILYGKSSPNRGSSSDYDSRNDKENVSAEPLKETTTAAYLGAYACVFGRLYVSINYSKTLNGEGDLKYLNAPV